MIGRETASSVWFQKAVRDLVDLLNMGPNWNGYGEKVIHPASAKRLVNLLDRMPYQGPPVAIVPLPNGGLQLEWHRGPKSVEVEIPPAGEAEGWFVDDSNKQEDEWVVSTAEGLDRLAECVQELLNA